MPWDLVLPESVPWTLFSPQKSAARRPLKGTLLAGAPEGAGPLQPLAQLENRALGPIGTWLNLTAARLNLHKVVPGRWVRRFRDALIELGDRPEKPDSKVLARIKEFYAEPDRRLTDLLQQALHWAL